VVSFLSGVFWANAKSLVTPETKSSIKSILDLVRIFHSLIFYEFLLIPNALSISGFISIIESCFAKV
jgi:hypothetical protein